MNATFEVQVRIGMNFTQTYIVTGESLTLKQAHDAALRDAKRLQGDDDKSSVIAIKQSNVSVLTTGFNE